MQLHFDYQMKLFYSQPVKRASFTIKCIPKDTARQHLVEKEIEILPKTPYSTGEDSYKNRMIYGRVDESHKLFRYRIRGSVEIFSSPYEEKAEINKLGIYRYPFGKCRPGEELKSYFAELSLPQNADSYEICSFLMHRLHEDFSYVPARTQVDTSAEEAWKMKMGVCQDYAHIFICLLRMAKIPARYVCGFLLGEGASHAWVEACCNGKWVGYDPTHDRKVQEQYIKLGDGRDAAECAINRGIILGGGDQTQEVIVKVTEQ